jgi:hypothetical protein
MRAFLFGLGVATALLSVGFFLAAGSDEMKKDKRGCTCVAISFVLMTVGAGLMFNSVVWE